MKLKLYIKGRMIVASLTTEGLVCQVVYKRYASLYFVVGIDTTDNELITLEIIHHFVEVLDRYFGNVCELDLIFNFHKARLLIHAQTWPHNLCIDVAGALHYDPNEH